MTEQLNVQQGQSNPAAIQPDVLGQLLKAGREAKEMTQQDISNSLRYSIRQIDALENHRFDELPDAMMTRGFIRSYAKLVDIDAEPLLAIYRKATGADEDKVISIKSSMPPVALSKESLPWIKYILASIVVLLLLLAWLFYVEFMPEKPAESLAVETPSNVNETVVPLSSQPVDVMPEAALPAAERAAEAEALASDIQQAKLPDAVQQPLTGAVDTQAGAILGNLQNQSPQNQPVSDVQSSASAKKLKLELVFSGDSWVGIKDKDGKVIYEEVSHAGDTDTVEFVPPANVTIGKTDVTKLMLNGKPIDFSANTKNNVARITLE